MGFLKKLEMHVIKNAQARLAKREAKQARIAHINEARKAMKNSLMVAETTAVRRVRKVEKEVKKAKTKKKYTVNKVGNLLKDLKSAPRATKENLKDAAKASAQSKIDAMGDALKRAKQETATAAKERKENDVFGDDY